MASSACCCCCSAEVDCVHVLGQVTSRHKIEVCSSLLAVLCAAGQRNFATSAAAAAAAAERPEVSEDSVE